MEEVSSGVAGMSACSHPRFVYLGPEKESTYFIFWTKHARLVRCEQCGEQFRTYQHP